MGKKQKPKYNSIIASYIQANITDVPYTEEPAPEPPRKTRWTRDKADPQLTGMQDAKMKDEPRRDPRPGSGPRTNDRFREVESAREGRLVLSITEDQQGRHSYSIEREIHDGRRFRHIHPRDAEDFLKLAEHARRWFADLPGRGNEREGYARGSGPPRGRR